MENKFLSKDITKEDIKSKFPLCAKKNQNDRSVFNAGGVKFGGKNLVIFAGPNIVELRKLIFDFAKNVKKFSANFLRGGAFKLLTFPYRSSKYTETREQGVVWLKEAKEQYNILVITEVMEEKYIPLVAKVADIIQIGSINMRKLYFSY